MLNSLQVTNFRAFENLSIDRLGKVNLIVGRNNVGKTSLLESIHLYVSDDVFEAAIRLLQRRQEYSIKKSGRTVALNNLFNQSAEPPSQIEIGEKLSSHQLVLKPMWSWTEEADREDGRLRVQRQFSDRYPDEILESEDTDVREVLAATRGDERTPQYVSMSLPHRYSSALRRRSEDPDKSLFLPSTGFHDDSVETANLWDRIVLTEAEEDVLN